MDHVPQLSLTIPDFIITWSDLIPFVLADRITSKLKSIDGLNPTKWGFMWKNTIIEIM